MLVVWKCDHSSSLYCPVMSIVVEYAGLIGFRQLSRTMIVTSLNQTKLLMVFLFGLINLGLFGSE
jgi:hypothetical protein